MNLHTAHVVSREARIHAVCQWVIPQSFGVHSPVILDYHTIRISALQG